jgi:hemerythrin-like domain-containing protein
MLFDAGPEPGESNVTKRRTGVAMIDRRQILCSLASAGSLILLGCAHSTVAPGAPGGEHGAANAEAEVTPGEDLMQEHGILERILLIYGEAARRVEGTADVDVNVVTQAARIVQSFIEEYHEKLEEQFVFPRLEAARRETDLVAVLRRQHVRGREVTAEILRRAATGRADSELAQLLRAFERMYRPHAAREDTVLFPAFRDVVGRSGYRELGEQFEDQEHQKFGEHGFENAVAQVARLEASLGIGELTKFTP